MDVIYCIKIGLCNVYHFLVIILIALYVFTDRMSRFFGLLFVSAQILCVMLLHASFSVRGGQCTFV
jgi:hypothetical protein